MSLIDAFACVELSIANMQVNMLSVPTLEVGFLNSFSVVFWSSVAVHHVAKDQYILKTETLRIMFLILDGAFLLLD